MSEKPSIIAHSIVKINLSLTSHRSTPPRRLDQSCQLGMALLGMALLYEAAELEKNVLCYMQSNVKEVPSRDNSK